MTKTIYDLPLDEIKRVVEYYQALYGIEHHFAVRKVMNTGNASETVEVRFIALVGVIDCHIRGTLNGTNYVEYFKTLDIFNHAELAIFNKNMSMVIDVKNALEHIVEDDTWRPYQ